MKKPTLIILFFVMLGFCGKAQDLLPTMVMEGDFDPEVEGTQKYVNDSSYYFYGNLFGQTWLNFRIFKVTQRDTYGNMLHASEHDYDTLSMVWGEQRRLQGTYYSNGSRRLLQSFIFNVAAAQWEMADSTYLNPSGNLSVYWYKVWDPYLQQFFRGERSELIYNETQDLHLKLSQEWDTISEAWKRKSYEVLQYNSQGLISEKLVKKWLDANQNWYDTLRMTYSYDNHENPDQEIHEMWVDGFGWQNIKKWDYFFNGNNLISELYEYGWSESLEAWVFQDFTKYSYDSDQNPEEKLEMFWDGEGWVNKSRILYTYKGGDLLAASLNQYWSFGFEDWQNASEYVYEYDENDNRSQYLFRVWQAEQNAWESYYKEEQYWSLFQAAGISKNALNMVQIFPNPANRRIQITAEQNFLQDFELKIVAVTGETVFRKLNCSAEQWIDVTDLARGVYLVQIITATEVITQKILISH